MQLFGWKGTLARQAYSSRLAIAGFFFVLLVLGPFTVSTMLGKTACSEPGCGSELYYVLVWLACYPVLLAALGLSAISLGVRRARDSGLPTALGLVPIIAVPDAKYFFFFAMGSPPWAIDRNYPVSLPPIFIGLAVLGMAALCLPASKAIPEGKPN